MARISRCLMWIQAALLRISYGILIISFIVAFMYSTGPINSMLQKGHMGLGPHCLHRSQSPHFIRGQEVLVYLALLWSSKRWVHFLIAALIRVLMFLFRTLIISWIIFCVLLRSFSIDVIIFLISLRILVLFLVVVALFIGKALPGRLTILVSLKDQIVVNQARYLVI